MNLQKTVKGKIQQMSNVEFVYRKVNALIL